MVDINLGLGNLKDKAVNIGHVINYYNLILYFKKCIIIFVNNKKNLF